MFSLKSSLLSVIPSLGAALTSAARLQLPPPRGSRAALCEDEETSLQVLFYLPSLRSREYECPQNLLQISAGEGSLA